MTYKLECIKIKEGLGIYFKNLFENKLIYHERVTILCELVKCELKEEKFSVELKAIKALGDMSEVQNRMFQHITSKPTFTVSATYILGSRKIINGKKIGRPYCPFLIFAEATVVEKICMMNDKEIEDNLYSMLWEK